MYPVFAELDSPFHILSLSERNKTKKKQKNGIFQSEVTIGYLTS